MSGNKRAYEEAFQRAVEGRSRSLWDRLGSVMEDQYTRQSRMKGERDGAASRAGGAAAPVETDVPVEAGAPVA
ncbi:MAG TPA: hypothetical protein VFQ76_21070 [Longimicrobiaceae bacterium]|nr:hypothetical protein [Longimicrobiaceae bacterium]